MLNRLLRLAAFQNPEFYKAQAMQLPPYNRSIRPRRFPNGARWAGVRRVAGESKQRRKAASDGGLQARRRVPVRVFMEGRARSGKHEAGQQARRGTNGG